MLPGSVAASNYLQNYIVMQCDCSATGPASTTYFLQVHDLTAHAWSPKSGRRFGNIWSWEVREWTVKVPGKIG